MRYLLPAFVLFAGLLTSCKDGSKPSAAETVSTEKPKIAVPPTSALDTGATNDLINMIGTYYGLKESLVATNGSEADKAASKLMWAGEQFKARVASLPQSATLIPLVKKVISRSDAISSSKPDSIEFKRARFAEISDAIYEITGAVKLKNAGIYHAYCPMAFDNKGAYWLSAESEIKNPYFGSKMMECGEVRDSL